MGDSAAIPKCVHEPITEMVVGRVKDAFHFSPSDDWRETLNAATMPVLQYVAIPGKVAAYGDPWRANPSLVYARTKQSATTMKYRVSDNSITYEWSVKPFDRFPDRPARLFAGKRLGFEVAVVDKIRTRGTSPPRLS